MKFICKCGAESDYGPIDGEPPDAEPRQLRSCRQCLPSYERSELDFDRYQHDKHGFDFPQLTDARGDTNYEAFFRSGAASSNLTSEVGNTSTPSYLIAAAIHRGHKWLQCIDAKKIEGLTEREKKVLVRHVYGGQTFKQIAEETRLSKSAVEKIFAAIKKYFESFISIT